MNSGWTRRVLGTVGFVAVLLIVDAVVGLATGDSDLDLPGLVVAILVGSVLLSPFSAWVSRFWRRQPVTGDSTSPTEAPGS